MVEVAESLIAESFHRGQEGCAKGRGKSKQKADGKGAQREHHRFMRIPASGQAFHYVQIGLKQAITKMSENPVFDGGAMGDQSAGTPPT